MYVFDSLIDNLVHEMSENSSNLINDSNNHPSVSALANTEMLLFISLYFYKHCVSKPVYKTTLYSLLDLSWSFNLPGRSEVLCVKCEWCWGELQGVRRVITAVICSLAAQQTMAPRRFPGCFYNTANSRRPSQWQSPLSQVHESRGSWQKSTSESHIRPWNALLLPQIREPSPSPTKLKYANRLVLELHVDTETDMYFLGAPFVKEIAA